MEEIEKVKLLCEKLGEKNIVRAIDSFVALQKELSSKKGEDFVNVSILGFIEGMLVSFQRKYPENEDVQALLEEVKAKRERLEEKFKRAKVPLFEGNNST
ncbi:methyltransferase [Thermococcus sp. EP1]|uniref:DUF3216 domain-containing protein n=1 Tax=Thermococcus sp. EP1 TaxID=1591054 RepID=UPI0006D99E87|nr:DUF3216 domain-containing protein [Thermococcus sp. EP1]KPU62596.1 methyltransferase [Thermococcus sp. EP1]